MGTHRNHLGAERIVIPSRPRAGAEMNVTPLIDILLVLLVIFMVVLPITQKGMDVDLPAVANDSPDVPQRPPDSIVLEYGADRSLAINSQDVALADLESRLRGVFAQRRDKTMFIMGAGTLRYGEVVKVIDAAKAAGVSRIGIVTDRMRQGRRDAAGG